MSERRERVAKAMYLSEYLPLDENAAATWDRYSPEYSNIKQRWLSLADAAMAAMDAEPTEAEIEATCPECGGHGRGCSFCGGTGDWPRTAEPTEAEIDAARHEYITNLDASIEAAKANADCQCYSRDDYPECVETIYENAGHEAMRAALIAARKARP